MQKGIWVYSDLLQPLEANYKLTLEEGNTPLDEKIIEKRKIYFKREDLNPNKSFKDRSLAYWISYYYVQNKRDFVISSSGNAANSAIAYSKLIRANLTVFVAENIPDYKFEMLQKSKEGMENIKIIKSKKPKSDAIKYSNENNMINLRGSSEDLAVEGFKTIAIELYEQNKDIDALFICCSSGTAVSGIFEGYKVLGVDFPKIHIVQTAKIHPIAGELDEKFITSPTSLANAVSDKIAKRKEQVLNIVHSTLGSGWVVSDTELETARAELTNYGMSIEGYNAYVAYAGFKKAIDQGNAFENPAVIISGI